MAWLAMIVRSRALDLLRRRKAERSHLTQDMAGAVQGRPDPENAVSSLRH